LDVSGFQATAPHAWEQIDTTMRHVLMLMAASNQTWSLGGFDVRDLAAAVKYVRFFRTFAQEENFTHIGMASSIAKVKISMCELAGVAAGRFLVHIAEFWAIRLKKDIMLGKKKIADIISKCIKLCDKLDIDGVLLDIEKGHPSRRTS
jgi:hypothetical protein